MYVATGGPTWVNHLWVLFCVFGFIGVSATFFLPVAPLGAEDPPDVRQQVIGADGRIQVTSTTAWPWRAIAHLKIDKYGVVSATCTGTFIGPTLLLTAAHCLWNTEMGGYADDVRVAPGKNGFIEPYGYDLAAYVWVPLSWRTGFGTDSRYDYGLIQMASSALGSQVGNFTVAVSSTETLRTPNLNPTIAGYPGDKPYGTLWVHGQSTFDVVQPYTLTYTIDTYSGESGAAIWALASASIVGVHTLEWSSYGIPYKTEGRRIDQTVLNDLLNYCVVNGCTFSYQIEPTPTATPTTSPTPTRTPNPSPTPTNTPTPTPSISPTPSPSATPTNTPTATPSTYRVYVPALARNSGW